MSDDPVERRRALVERLLGGIARRLSGDGREVTTRYIPPLDFPAAPPGKRVVEHVDEPDLHAELRARRVRLLRVERALEEIAELDGQEDPEVLRARQRALDEALDEIEREVREIAQGGDDDGDA